MIKMTTNPIKSFSIYGLFGTTDVHIPLDEPVKILVGENGLGKTQVLNLFYYTLTQKFSKLAEFYFDKLVLTFANGKIFEFKNNKNVLSHNPPFEKQKEVIQHFTNNLDILYFPTFRRVESDFVGGIVHKTPTMVNAENKLIQFGMEDVQNKFNEIQEKIDKMLKESLAQFTKDILNTMTDDTEFDANDILNKINESDIDIILSRVGEQLPLKQKVAIKNIVRTKQFKNPFHAYLLQKLVESYEKQTGLDNSIKIFRDICNKYLIQKEVFYDESRIKIFVKSTITEEEIHLSKLSSGEKQVISIFSKIYLSEVDKRFIVLFDEPELSLSMLWQRQLLPDIVNSKKCNFLLAVTHSPFIFDNELDKYAVGLEEYVKPIKGIVAMHKSVTSKSN
jgi:predicted ATP-dependent endonuclease of OLD family